MTRKSCLPLLLLLGLPALAHALGLGDIHLHSALNQPLSADIDLLGATAEELKQLRATVPSREIFARYGVDQQAFLSGVTFRVDKDSSGHSVLAVHSTEPATEPFVTLLVEVSWPRGRLIREFTVLLDPPVFEQRASAAPPVAAPTTGTAEGQTAGSVVRTPAAESAAPGTSAAVAAARPEAAAGGASPYRVMRNDSLSVIARRSGARTAADINRLMIATFRANPDAFDGNINRLRSGSLLNIPAQGDWQALGAAEAAREVGRQTSAWRAAQPASRAAEQAHLRLVMPAEGGTGGTAQAAAPAPAPSPRADAAHAAAEEKQAAEAKRLLDFKNAELARLQAQAKTTPAAKPEPSPPAPAPAQPAVVQPAPAATPPPAAALPTEPAAPRPAAEAKPAKVTAAPAAEPGLLDRLLGNLLYVALGIVVLLIAALAGFALLRRRREDSTFDDSLHPDVEPQHAPAAALTPTRTRSERASDEILVEESDDDSGTFASPPHAALAVPAITAAQPLGSVTEDTLGPDTALNLEQADPLAEADFHMAYGLYDQAADIVKGAIERQPTRRDLKLKLLEVYFVWGNKEAFLDVARELGRGRDQSPEAEWEKVAIMGRQLAPEDALFAGTARGTAARTAVDLDLDAGGPAGMDLELLGDSGLHRTSPAAHPGREPHTAHVPVEAADDTAEPPTLDPDRIDLLLDGEQRGYSAAPAHEAPARRDSPTVEQPALVATAAAETPTVEMPALAEPGDQSLRDKLESAFKHEAGTQADATAELSLDDLGFDADKLEASSTSLASLKSVEPSAEGATLVAGLDERSRARLADAGHADLEPTAETPRPAQPDLEPTRETPRPPAATGQADVAPPFDPVRTERLPEMASGDTGTQRVLGTGELDLDLDQLTRALESDTSAQPRRDEMRFVTDVFATGIHKAPNGIDLDVGAPSADSREPTVTERISAGDLDLPELEPVTLSEVGTKLDLARAYMDMGDPDGARSILQEVLSEGSASQKQEAQRLIETLPG